MSETKQSILAVIPARSGSKRVPKKNIRNLGNKALVSYLIESAGKSKLIDKLILSTDDYEIKGIGMSLGVEIPFERPDYLSSDYASLISVVKHAYNYYRELGVNYDAVVSLQPTCPFTSVQTIDKIISLWKRTKCDSVTTVAEITQGHPYIAKSLKGDGVIKNFCIIPEDAVVTPSQKREKAYYLTGGIYLRDKRILDSNELTGHCLGTDSRGVVVSEIEAVDINTEADFKYAQFLQEQGILNI